MKTSDKLPDIGLLSLSLIVTGICLYVLSNNSLLMKLAGLDGEGTSTALGIVSNVENQVNRRSSRQLVWNDISNLDRVFDKDRIMTGPGSQVNLDLGDIDLSAGENSMIILHKLDELKELEVLYGQMQVKLKAKTRLKIRRGKIEKIIKSESESSTIRIKNDREEIFVENMEGQVTDLSDESNPQTLQLAMEKAKKALPESFTLLEVPEGEKIWFSNEKEVVLPLAKNHPQGVVHVIRKEDFEEIHKEIILEDQNEIRLKTTETGELRAIFVPNDKSDRTRSQSFFLYQQVQPKAFFPVGDIEIQGQTQGLNMSWSKIPETQSYRLQISRDQSFSETILDEKFSSEFYAWKLPKEGKQFYWRVKVEEGLSPNKKWSQTYPIHLMTPQEVASLPSRQEVNESIPEPEPEIIEPSPMEKPASVNAVPKKKPASINPIPKKKPVSTASVPKKKTVRPKLKPLTPTAFEQKVYKAHHVARSPSSLAETQMILELKWDQVKGAKSYRIELFASSAMKERLQVLDTKKTQITLKQTVKTATKPVVRVSVIDRNFKRRWNRRSISSISLKKSLALETPTLRQPANNSQIYPLVDEEEHSSAVILSWQEVPHAQTYKIQASSDPQFKTNITELTSERPIHSMNIPVKKGKFYWRVQAIHEQGQSPWSNHHGFELK
ncbi:MAG: DUF4962 domain-containing protein [Pseudomonadota bacterium]